MMSKARKILFEIGIFILLVLFIYVLFNHKGNESYRLVNVKTDTIYKDSLVHDTFYKFSVKIKEVPVPAIVDTQLILKKYFAIHSYDDTLKNDSSAFIQIKEVVTNNELKRRELIFVNKQPDIIKQTTILKAQSLKRSFHTGIYLSTVNRQLDVGGLLEIKNKKISYEFGYSPFTKSFMVGAKIQIY